MTRDREPDCVGVCRGHGWIDHDLQGRPQQARPGHKLGMAGTGTRTEGAGGEQDSGEEDVSENILEEDLLGDDAGQPKEQEVEEEKDAEVIAGGDEEACAEDVDDDASNTH